MNEEMLNLMSAHIDGEIGPSDQAKLDAHLAAHPEDRELMEAMTQDGDQLESALFDMSTQNSLLQANISNAIRREQVSRGSMWGNTLLKIAAGILIGAILSQSFDQGPKPGPQTDNPGTAPKALLASVDAHSGPMEIQKGGQWQPIQNGTPIFANDIIRTGQEGRATLRHANGSRMYLDAEAVVNFRNPEKVQVEKGTMWFLTTPQNFTVVTPECKVQSNRANFVVSHDPKGTQINNVEGQTLLYFDDQPVQVDEMGMDQQHQVFVVKHNKVQAVTPKAQQLYSTSTLPIQLVMQVQDQAAIRLRVKELVEKGISNHQLRQNAVLQLRALGPNAVGPLTEILDKNTVTFTQPEQRELCYKLSGDLSTPLHLNWHLNVLKTKQNNKEALTYSLQAVERMIGTKLGNVELWYDPAKKTEQQKKLEQVILFMKQHKFDQHQGQFLDAKGNPSFFFPIGPWNKGKAIHGVVTWGSVDDATLKKNRTSISIDGSSINIEIERDQENGSSTTIIKKTETKTQE